MRPCNALVWSVADEQVRAPATECSKMATANVEEAIDEIEDAIVTQQTPVSPVHARDFEDSPSDNPEKRPWYRRPSPFFILVRR